MFGCNTLAVNLCCDHLRQARNQVGIILKMKLLINAALIIESGNLLLVRVLKKDVSSPVRHALRYRTHTGFGSGHCNTDWC